MLDVNGDGNQDVILRPQLCGGVPTNSFLYSSYSEDGNGIKLNDCIWLNDGAPGDGISGTCNFPFKSHPKPIPCNNY